MLVELEKVTAYYRLPGRVPVKALDGVELTISAGEVVGLLGPNGAGKTTLMRLILGLMHADSGYVSVLGLDPATQRHQVVRQCGAIIDGQRELPPRWTPLDLLTFVGVSYGLPNRVIRQRATNLLERFGLAEFKNTVINSFSRGMRQKLSLALAFLHEPRFLVLDEPTLGLDVEATREMLELISSFASSGRAVLISSHQLTLIEHIAHKVVVLYKGRTIFHGSPEALIRRVGRGRVELEFEELPDQLVEALSDTATVAGRQVTVPLDVDSLTTVLRIAQRFGARLVNVNRSLDLESAYLALLEKEA